MIGSKPRTFTGLEMFILNGIQAILFLAALALLLTGYVVARKYEGYEALSRRDGRMDDVALWRRRQGYTGAAAIALAVPVVVLALVVFD